MASQTAIAGNWNDLKGRIRSKWGQMTDDSLEQAKGNMESLVGSIQKTTGEAKETIQAYLNAGMQEGASLYKQASDAVQAGAGQVVEGAKMVGETIKTGAEQTGKLVQARPIESLLFTFAAGAIAGLTLGLVLRSK